MEDVHCLKRRSMTARVGCLFQQCFSFLLFFCISADCSFNGSHDSYNVYDGV